MKNFEENVDYHFLNPNEVKALTKTESNVSFVAVKDSEDYSQDAIKSLTDTVRLNRVYYGLIRSVDEKFVNDCVNYAISKHVAGLKKWQTEINVVK